MGSYVALDVSLRSTSVHVVDEAGKCLWRGKCATDPEVLVAVVRKHAPGGVRVDLGTVRLAPRPGRALSAGALRQGRMDAGEAREALSGGPNKTGGSDTERLAQLLRTDLCREVRVTSRDGILIRSLAAGRP